MKTKEPKEEIVNKDNNLSNTKIWKKIVKITDEDNFFKGKYYIRWQIIKLKGRRND